MWNSKGPLSDTIWDGYLFTAQLAYLLFCLVSCHPRFPVRLLFRGGILMQLLVLPSTLYFVDKHGFDFLSFGQPLLWWPMCVIRLGLSNDAFQPTRKTMHG